MPKHPRASLIEFCAKLPHATRDIKWGDHLVFSIGNKMFASFHDAGGTTVSFKTSPETFAHLTRQPGVIPAPYAARFHWVLVQTRDALPAGAIKALLHESYTLVFDKLPAKSRKQLAAVDGSTRIARRTKPKR